MIICLNVMMRLIVLLLLLSRVIAKRCAKNIVVYKDCYCLFDTFLVLP